MSSFFKCIRCAHIIQHLNKYGNMLNMQLHMKLYQNTFRCQKMCTAASVGENAMTDNNSSTPCMESGNELEAIPGNFPSESDVFGNMRVSMEKVNKKIKRKAMKQSEKLNEIDNKNNYNIRKQTSREVDDADRFGDLWKVTGSPMYYSETPIKDDGVEPGNDGRFEFPLEKEYRSPEIYLNEMKKLVRDNKLKEALELIPHMKRNNVFPIVSNYTFLIGACGRVGYTEMAFKLLRQMLDRGFRPTMAVLTGLYNSCAECPFPNDGLGRARFLREKITEKNWQMNRTSYHAMIKAFGKCGDLQTAFEVVDEMMGAGILPISSTYNFLLMACISDKEAGFTHAVEVWRKMCAKRIPPNIFTFNLLLRAVRDCGTGPEEISSLLLQHWSSYRKRPYGLNQQGQVEANEFLKLPNPEFANTKLLGSSVEPPDDKLAEVARTEGLHSRELLVSKEQSDSTVTIKVLPNILSRRPVSGFEVSDLAEITTATDRLALIGNAEGYLELMKLHKSQPDIKTFTLLLECLPPDTDAEEALVLLLETHKVRPNTDFFNILIKKRNMRKRFDLAKKVLLLINKHNLCPDIVTFGVLAIGCFDMKKGVQLLRDMKNLGYSANVEIIGALINEAAKSIDFPYLKYLLNVMRKDEIKPNEKILTKIEISIERARELVVMKEQGKESEDISVTEYFCSDFKTFCEFYTDWLKVMKVDHEEHIWDQYKADISLRASETS